MASFGADSRYTAAFGYTRCFYRVELIAEYTGFAKK